MNDKDQQISDIASQAASWGGQAISLRTAAKALENEVKRLNTLAKIADENVQEAVKKAQTIK